MFNCEVCENLYKSAKALKRHVQSVHENLRFACDVCEVNFTRVSSLKKHVSTQAGQNTCKVNVLRARAIHANVGRSYAAVPSSTTAASGAATASSSSSSGAATAAASTSSSFSTTASTSSSSSSSLSSGAGAASTLGVLVGLTSKAPPSPTSGAGTSPPPSPTSGAGTSPPPPPTSGAGTSPPPPPTSGAGTSSSSSSSSVGGVRYCSTCKQNVAQNYWAYHVRTNVHKRNSGSSSAGNYKILHQLFNGRIQSFVMENEEESELRAEVFLQQVKGPLIKLLEEMLVTHTSYKWNLELFGEYVKMADDDISAIDIKSHQTKMKPSVQTSNLVEMYDDMCHEILTKMSEFQERDSGWTIVKLLHLEININSYRPLVGSSYIPLPMGVYKKKACVNIQNEDEYCFKWAIISSLKTNVRNENRCGSYKIEDITAPFIDVGDGLTINFSGMTFPLQLKDIARFEDQNGNISVNVFGYDDDIHKVVGPYYISKHEKNHHVNLLLLQHDEKSHYVLIKSLSR